MCFCYRRTGALFEGRYKATIIHSESYLLTCMRYIELNPVRAGMADGPAGYPWPSYGVNALGQANGLVAPHLEYLRFWGGVEEAHHAAYCGLLEHHIPAQCINDIPDATNKSWALGNDRFKQRIEDQINRYTQSKGRRQEIRAI
jgi:putative transposase